MNKTDQVAWLNENRTETEDIILRRRSVRIYKKEQVPEFMVKRILEAGRFAPSAGNYQPWKFVVVRDGEIIDRITATVVEKCKSLKKMIDYRRPGYGWLRPFSNLLIRLKSNELHPAPFGAISMIADGKFGLYHGAPTVIFIFKDVRGVSNPDLDCGIAGQNMVLAAHSLNLGTCWVGFTKLAFEGKNNWNGFFDIRFPYRFISSIGIGWPKGDPDGMVPRQTHAIDWYESNEKKTIY